MQGMYTPGFISYAFRQLTIMPITFGLSTNLPLARDAGSDKLEKVCREEC